MNRKTTFFTIGLVFLVVLALIFLNSKFTGFTAKEESFTVGFIGPFTGFGAAWGIEQQRAFDIALEEINNKNEVKIDVVYEDGKCNGKDAVSAAQKLISIDKVDLLIAVCSSEVLAVAPLAEENKIILLGVWSTNPAISEAGDYVFRISYSDIDTGRTIAETLSKHDKIGMITELTDYPIGLRDAVKIHYSGEIIEESNLPNSKNVRTQLTKIISKDPKAIFLNPNSVEIGLEELRILNELKFTKPIYANFFGESSKIINSSYADGLIFFSDPIVPENMGKETLLKKYFNLYNDKPDFEFAVAATYDSAKLISRAINEGGTESHKIKKYLYDIEDFEGLLGRYRFDSNGDVIGLKPGIKQIKNKEVHHYKNL